MQVITIPYIHNYPLFLTIITFLSILSDVGDRDPYAIGPGRGFVYEVFPLFGLQARENQNVYLSTHFITFNKGTCLVLEYIFKIFK